MMKKISQFESFTRQAGMLLIAGCTFAMPMAVSAGDQKTTVKEDAQKAGRATGHALHEVGKGLKQAGKEVGSAAKAGGKEFHRAIKGN